MPQCLFAEAIPALSHATGRNSINGYFAAVTPAGDGNIDLMTKKRGDNVWPAVRDDTHWLHGDFRDVAYFYNYPLYDDIVAKGGLK